MAELFDMKELEERVILIAVSTDDEDDTRASLDELEELVKTAGGITADKMIQNSFPTRRSSDLKLMKSGNASGNFRPPA